MTQKPPAPAPANPTLNKVQGNKVDEILKRKIAQTGAGGLQDPTYEPGFNIRATPTYRPLKAAPVQVPQPTQAATDFISSWRENAYKQQFTNGKPNGTKVLGPDGKALPTGAQLWDWNGDAYYGEGFWGWSNKLYSKLHADTTASLSQDDMDNFIIPGTPEASYYLTPEQIKQNEALLAKAGYGDDWFANQKIALERYWNMGATAEGKPTTQTMIARLPGVVGEGLMDTFSMPWEQVQRGATGAANVANALILNQIQDFNDVKDVYMEGAQTGRLMATSTVDHAVNLLAGQGWKSAVEAEYRRRYAAGENPDLLEAELANPLMEGILDLAVGIAPLKYGGFLDPVNWLGHLSKVKGVSDITKGMETVARVTPDITDAMAGLSKVTDEVKAGEQMTKVVDAIGDNVIKGAARIEEMSKDIGIFKPTAGGKRFRVMGQQVGTIIKWIAAEGGSTEKVMDVLEGLWKMGKGAAMKAAADTPEALAAARAMLAEGFTQISTLNYIDPLLSDAGAETASIMYRILGDDPQKFLEATREASLKGADDLIAHINKTMESKAGIIFPTLTERIKVNKLAKAKKAAGAALTDAEVAALSDQINEGLVALDAFHQAATKNVYNRLNSFFTGVYMGASPGFASRNMISNLTHVMIDRGIGAIFDPEWIKGKFLKGALGFEPGVYNTDIAKGVQDTVKTAEELAKEIEQAPNMWDRLKKMSALTLSNWFENMASQMVVTSSVKKTFEIALQEGRAIPSTVPLIAAGVSKETAVAMVRLLVKHDGDVNAAMKEFRMAQKVGYMDLLSTMAHIAPEDMKLLNALPGDIAGELKKIYTQASEEGWTSKRLQGEIAALRERLKDVGRADTPTGVTLFDDMGNLTPEAQTAMDMGAVNDARESGKMAQQIVESHIVANQNARTAQNMLMQRIWPLIEANSDIPPQVKRAAQAMVNNIPYAEVSTAYQRMQNNAHFWGEATKASNFYSSGEAAKIWAAMDMEGPMPMNPKEFRRILWEEWYYPNVRGMWEKLVDDQQRILANAMQYIEPDQSMNPLIQKLMDDYALERAWRKVDADYTNGLQFSTARLRGDNASANRILAQRWMDAFETLLGPGVDRNKDDFLVGIINQYLAKRPTATPPINRLSDADPLGVTLPALSDWLRTETRKAQAAAAEATRAAKPAAQAAEAARAAQPIDFTPVRSALENIKNLISKGETGKSPNVQTAMDQGIAAAEKILKDNPNMGLSDLEALDKELGSIVERLPAPMPGDKSPILDKASAVQQRIYDAIEKIQAKNQAVESDAIAWMIKQGLTKNEGSGKNTLALFGKPVTAENLDEFKRWAEEYRKFRNAGDNSKQAAQKASEAIASAKPAQAAQEAARPPEAVAELIQSGKEKLGVATRKFPPSTDQIGRAIELAIFNNDMRGLPDDLVREIKNQYGVLYNRVMSGEKGQRIYTWVDNQAGPIVTAQGTTHVPFYGEQGAQLYNTSYNGKDGKAGVLAFIQDMIDGKPLDKSSKIPMVVAQEMQDLLTRTGPFKRIMGEEGGKIHQLIFDMDKRLAQATSAEAEQIMNEAIDLLNSLDITPETSAKIDDMQARLQQALDRPTDWKNLTDDQKYALNIALAKQEIELLVDRAFNAIGRTEIPNVAAAAARSPYIPTGNEAMDFATAFQEAMNLSDDEADVFMRLADSYANTWSAITGRPVDEWYALNIGDLSRGGKPMKGARGIKSGAKTGAKIMFDEDGRAIIQGFKSADSSTAINAMARVFKNSMYRTVGDITNESEKILIMQDIRTLEQYFGVKGGAWTKTQEDKFASAFERYVADGETEVPALKRIFEQLRNWLKRIYTNIVGTRLDQELTPEVKQVFDRMLVEGPRPLRPYSEGTPMMPNIQVRGGFDSIDNLFARIMKNTDASFGKIVPMEGTSADAAKAIAEWEKEAAKRTSQMRYFAAKKAEADRNFTMLDYPDKKGLDLVLGYIFPYQFWYSRSYVRWMKRVASNPKIIANYARYRRTLAKMHAGAPDWWKYNLNSNDFGANSEVPMFFNLEQTINPVNGITGGDFTSPYAKLTWYTQLVDNLGKFGPNVWTPFNWAMALALSNEAGKGKFVDPNTGEPTDYEGAARYYAGRLIPQTTTIKNMLTLAGQKGKLWGQSGINELDPIVLAFQGGMDYYERRRAGRAAAQLVGSGKYTDAQVLEAFQKQEGPAWEDAVQTSIMARAGNPIQTLMPFILGVGFKARTASDIEIDRFDQEYRSVWAMKDMLSPDELRDKLAALKEKYPWSDAVILSRKTGMERDRSYAYNVLSRIPPGASADVWKAVGLDERIASQFYDNKGDLNKLSEQDRTDFMQAVIALGAILDLPPAATRQEWNAARTAYNQLMTQARSMFGDTTMDELNIYYALPLEQKQAFMEANPDVDAAKAFIDGEKQTNPELRDYYASFDTITNYYTGVMYDELRREFGDLSPLWDQYNLEALKGNAYKKAFWNANPILQRYLDKKAMYERDIALAIRTAGEKLNTIPLVIRPDAVPTSVRQQDVMNLATSTPDVPVYQMSWPELSGLLSAPLARLVEDYVLRGDDLSSAAMSQIERAAARLNITGDQFLVIAEQAIQQSVATP